MYLIWDVVYGQEVSGLDAHPGLLEGLPFRALPRALAQLQKPCAPPQHPPQRKQHGGKGRGQS